MNVEDIRNYCLSLKGAEECFPFDDETLVFKALGKMFAFIPLEESDLCINLKCNPEKAVDLRADRLYDDVFLCAGGYVAVF